MNWAKLLTDLVAAFAEIPPKKSLAERYAPLALLAVVLAALLVKAVRVWQEIHEVEEPATPSELLASLEDAHAAGELDDIEMARVRQRLETSQTGALVARESQVLRAADAASRMRVESAAGDEASSSPGSRGTPGEP